MLKTFIYTLLATALLIGGGLILSKRLPQTRNSENGQVIVLGKNGSIEGAYSLQTIISLDEWYQCQFEKDDGHSSVEGDIFIAPGAKVRGDFEINSPSEPKRFQSHFIMRDGFSYTWTSLLNAGFRAPVVTGSSTDVQIFSTGEKINYNCSRTKTNQSKFEIPQDIIFQDMNR